MQLVVDQAENSHLPASMCRLKTQQYRDPRQTSCHKKSVDSPFGRYTLYSVSYFDQLADLWVAVHCKELSVTWLVRIIKNHLRDNCSKLYDILVAVFVSAVLNIVLVVILI